MPEVGRPEFGPMGAAMSRQPAGDRPADPPAGGDIRGRDGPARERAALALAAGRTVAEAAKEAGRNRRTLTRWLADADFRDLVTDLRIGMVSRAVGLAADAMADAVATLRELLTSADPGVRRLAAAKLWDCGLEGVSLSELEKLVAQNDKRITELERREGLPAGDQAPELPVGLRPPGPQAREAGREG